MKLYIMDNSDNADNFISLDNFLLNKKIDNKINKFSNLQDVVLEDLEELDKSKYIYQIQFINDNTFKHKLIGYTEKDKPDINLGEFIFDKNKIKFIERVYNNINIKIKDTIELYCLLINQDMKISMSIKVNNIHENNIYTGIIQILYKSKIKNEYKEVCLKELNKFPKNKVLEYLIKELSNPIILEDYD